jgi:cytochrome c-type biogenesis protein CcmH
MKYTLSCTLVLLALNLGAARRPVFAIAGPQETAPTVASAEQEDPELEANVRKIASNLRCPTCRALSVQDSPSGMAQEMRDLVREKLREGMTEDEIYVYFVDRYGEWILLKPKASGFNWTVWLLPVLMLAIGLAFVLTTARRWVRQGQEREATLLDEQE